uniref:Endonuclease/exonuclease/phosphatase domain-containing protein n=1 Tax=Sus scrofa TaxID=9823 RepID=A0A8W4FB16_PIG
CLFSILYSSVALSYVAFLTALKGEIDCNIVIVGDFNTPLTAMDRSSRQKINKETLALNDALDQMYLTDTYRPSHPKAAEYTFFSSAHGTFSRIDHILGHKSGKSQTT